MLNNNKLSDRLNAFKNGEEIPENVSEKLVINKIENELAYNKITLIKSIFNELLGPIIILLISFLYGIGISAITSMNWNYLEILGVGFIFYQIWDFIISIKQSN